MEGQADDEAAVAWLWWEQIQSTDAGILILIALGVLALFVAQLWFAKDARPQTDGDRPVRRHEEGGE